MNRTEYKPPAQLEKEVVEWCCDTYDQADREMADSHEAKLTSKIIDYIGGKQWNSKARFGRSRPVVNRTVQKFIEMVGLLTDLELDFQVRFHDKVDGFSELQAKMNEIIVDWAFENDFESDLSMVVMYGLIHTGPAKIQWNPFLNNGMGDVEMKYLSPLNFMRVGASQKVQESEVCILREVVTLAYLRRRYGKVAEAVTSDAAISQLPGDMVRPARMSKQTWLRLNPVLKRMLGQKGSDVQSNFPQTLLKEFWMKDDAVWDGSESIVIGPKDAQGRPLANWSYWVEPGMPIYPRGRVVAIAGGKVLDDDCNPYWHSKMPFAVYRAFRVPWMFEGQSVMEPIAAMQSILNRVYGGVMDTVNSAIEPSIMGPKSAFSQGDWDIIDPGAPAAKIAYNNNSPRPPEWRTPPQLPSYVDAFKNDIKGEMDATSGASAISQAMGKKQIPGGDALDMIFNSRSINVRFMGRNLKSFLTEAGGLLASNMLQFYTAKHRIAKYGVDGLTKNDVVPFYGHLLPRGIEPEEFVRKATFSIRKGSLLSIEKAEKIPIAFQLRKQGDLSRHGLYRFLDTNIDLKKNDEELKAEMAEKAAIAVAAGALQSKGHKK